MREAIGGTWIFTIVIVFIVLFSSYLAISVNYGKAFKVKNGIVDIIERSKGYNDAAKTKIEAHLKETGYYVYNPCPEASDAATTWGKDLETAEKEETPRQNVVSDKRWYCIYKVRSSSSDLQLPRVYYKVVVFFKLDLPIIGNLFTFPIYGDTKTINSPKD